MGTTQEDIFFLKESKNKLSTPLECKIPKPKCWATDEINNTFNEDLIINIFNDKNINKNHNYIQKK